jgi:hypothetical protein
MNSPSLRKDPEKPRQRCPESRPQRPLNHPFKLAVKSAHNIALKAALKIANKAAVNIAH